MLQQIVYISTASEAGDATLAAILESSQRRNGEAGVTGFLFFDGKRFLQALEGAEADVQQTYQRIRADPRHRSVVLLSDRRVAAREFGDWAMACRTSPDLEMQMLDKVRDLVAGASPSVRSTFTGFADIRAVS